MNDTRYSSDRKNADITPTTDWWIHHHGLHRCHPQVQGAEDALNQKYKRVSRRRPSRTAGGGWAAW